MKKKSTSKSAFLNLRVLTGLLVGLSGAALMLIALSTWSKALAQQQPSQKESNATDENPAARMAWERLRLQDEHGQIPVGALRRAYEQRKAMPFQPEAWAEFLPKNAMGQPEAVQSIWTSIGPWNIGGRTRSIIIHPTNANIMWLGAVGGGVWKTADGGSTWSTTTDFLANLAVSCMAMDATNSNVLYAGTGEPGPIDGIRGNGIFKTTDAGSTWTQLTSTANNPNFYWVTRLAANLGLANCLLATTTAGIFKSLDGGVSWSQPKTGSWNMVVFQPGSRLNCLATSSLAHVEYSIDGGSTWAVSTFSGTTPAGRIEVAYARSNPNIVYASSERPNNGTLYRSTDAGHSFAPTGATQTLGGNGWYTNALWVDPTNPNTVVVGGFTLWRSYDGGSNLVEIGQNNHVDHHSVISHPNYDGGTNKTVYQVGDGGIYKTIDVLSLNVTWTTLNHKLGITQFYRGAGDSAGSTIIGGTQDNYTLRYQGDAQGWTIMEYGDGGACAVGGGYFYGEREQLNGPFRSPDGGRPIQYINNGLTDSGTNANWTAPIVLDPNNSNRLLAGGVSLWRSNNPKDPNPQLVAWTVIKQSNGSNISAIAVAPGNSDVIWVGHNNGDIYLTTNGTAVAPDWTKVDGSSPFPGRMCESIAIGPPSARYPLGKIYVTFSGYSVSTPNGVWTTENNGQTWTNVSNGLPDAPVHSLVISPRSVDYGSVYIGTEVGVFASSNGGLNWSPGVSGDVPANVAVDQLFWTDRTSTTLVAVTHGRGMFTANTQ